MLCSVLSPPNVTPIVIRPGHSMAANASHKPSFKLIIELMLYLVLIMDIRHSPHTMVGVRDVSDLPCLKIRASDLDRPGT